MGDHAARIQPGRILRIGKNLIDRFENIRR
jgi:hypothetical protein